MFKSLVLACAAVVGTGLFDPGAAAPSTQFDSHARDTEVRTITVLTYNTHLFQESSAEVGRWFKGKPEPIVFEDLQRRQHIAERIRASGADIVALQEVWHYEWQDWFREQLKDVYPYSYRPSELEGRFDLKGWDIFRELGRTTSGLVLLSKFKLKDMRFHAFPDERTKKEQDRWSTKGVVTATVEPWPGGPTFRVGLTHACTDVGGVDQPDLMDLAVHTAGAPHKGPAIMMGDFNSPRSNVDKYGPTTKQYERLSYLFSTVGAVDAYRKRNNNVNDPTVNWPKNLLAQMFFYNPEEPKCLDYVFVRESGPGLTLEPEKVEVINDWKYQTKVDWWRVHVGVWNNNYVAVQTFQLKGHPHLLAFAKNDHIYIRRLKEGGRGWAVESEAFGQKMDTNYVPTAITTFQLNGHPYFFVLKAKALFKQSDTASIYRINDDGKGWTLAWHGKWDSDSVAVRSFQLNGHPYLFVLHENDKAYIRRINDDGKGYTQTFVGKWDSAYVGTAITPFELNGRPYVFALNRNKNAVIRRIKDDGKGWEDVYAGKWDTHNFVAVQSFQLNGHPHLFGLGVNDKVCLRRIKDDGKGWEEVFEGGWASNYVPTAITTFDLGGQAYVFALKQNDQAWITRLQKPEAVSMDLSDHFPVKVTFKVTRTPAPQK